MTPNVKSIPELSIETYQYPEGETYAQKEVFSDNRQVQIPGFDIRIKLSDLF